MPTPIQWAGIASAVGLGVYGLSRAFSKPTERAGSRPAGLLDSPKGLTDMQALMKSIGIPNNWQVFFAAVAHHESGWNSNAWNQSDSEVKASGIAYENTIERYENCPYPKSAYAIGSGGWGGLLPPYGMAAFWGTKYQCFNPRLIFDPVWALSMMIGFARRLRNYSGFQSLPTWENLNRGWAGSSYMGSPRPATDERFEKALNALRARGWTIPTTWKTRTVEQLPVPTSAEIIDRFAAQAVTAAPEVAPALQVFKRRVDRLPETQFEMVID